MKNIKHATDIVRLITAVLLGISAGFAATKNARDLVRSIAEDEGLVEKLVHEGRDQRARKGEAK
ncbi:hypothetical protein [Amycolatopsis sp. NPDC021455]|uniref:hypothetical protein n=1 Tax=Amycolatopsis sp. NPDC021455 TaxID=3154901 RepID=UPI0033D0B349